MRERRLGQVSMEYVMLLGALLLILCLLMVVLLGQYAQQSLVAQNRLAEHTLNTLAVEAQQVWAGGPGAERRVLVELPPTTDLARSNISGSVLQLYLGGQGDVSRALPFALSGTWPNHTGRAYLSLYHNGSALLVRNAGGLFINTTGIYQNMSLGSSNLTRLLIVNQAGSDYAIVQTLNCSTNLTCTYSGVSGVIASGGSQTADLNISAIVRGTWGGYLSINATPAYGSGLPNETFLIPIGAQVY